MKKTVFITALFFYMLAFNLLVLNAITKNSSINNIFTGSSVYLGSNPVVNPAFVTPLFLFNLGIIALFVYSYHNFNLYSKVKQHTSFKKA